jgi:hypothetical protein
VAKENLEEDIEELYGKPLSEWDFQELQCGRPRNKDGKVSRRGKRPAWISPAMAQEAMRRLATMTSEEVGKYAGDAVATMVDLMKTSRLDLVRFQAAQYVLNQIMGMPTVRTESTVDVNVHTFLADIIRNPDGVEHPIIQGTYAEVVDDEEDDDDDGS